MTCSTVPAFTSTSSAPAVYLRSGAGMTTLSDMGHSFHDPLEGIDLCIDDFGGGAIDCIRSFQTISGNSDHRDAAAIVMAAFDQLFGDGNGDAARRFGEDSLSFGQEMNSGGNFRVGGIVGPAAGFQNQACGVVAVSGIAD